MAVAQLWIVRHRRRVFFMCRAKELQNRIEQLRKDIARICSTHTNATAEISKLQSEMFVAASQLTEISTRRIIRLTWFLAILTAALLAYTILIYEDAHATIEHPTFTQNYEAK